MVIGVAGCVAQAEGAEIIARAPVVDMVFGPQTFQQLPAMLKEIEETRAQGRNRNWCTRNFPPRKICRLAGWPRKPVTRSHRLLSPCKGCDKFYLLCCALHAR